MPCGKGCPEQGPNLHTGVAARGTGPSPMLQWLCPCNDLHHLPVANGSSYASFFLTCWWHLTSQTTPIFLNFPF